MSIFVTPDEVQVVVFPALSEITMLQVCPFEEIVQLQPVVLMLLPPVSVDPESVAFTSEFVGVVGE